MKIANFNQGVFSACLTILFVSSTSHAEIYKWVDANGRTHYSEKKEDAKAKALELKVKSEPVSASATGTPTEYWQDQERKFRQRQAQQAKERANGSAVDARPKSLSGGRSDETSASRCNLARDVISGAVRHPNGAPTDEYDRKVAENDIRTYCH
jgi:hypothetical protein